MMILFQNLSMRCGRDSWPGLFTLRGKLTTLGRSRCNPGGAKAAGQMVHRILGARHGLELLAGNLRDNLLRLPLQGKDALPSLRKGCASIAVEPRIIPNSAVEIAAASEVRSFRSEDNGPVPLSMQPTWLPSEQLWVAIGAACRPDKMTLPPQRWVSSLLQDPTSLDGGNDFNCGIRDNLITASRKITRE